MAKEMPKAYEPKLVEDTIYQKWLTSGYFNPDNLPNVDASSEAFTVVMPPPNVTGILHLGHALENSLMDSMVRYQRLLGKKVLLIPGTDHAAIATQARVEKNLIAAGMKNPRQELGREGLLEKIREFAESSKTTIINQVKKLGTSADWSRLAYTFDEPRNKAVNALFTKMYNDGLIYRGFRVVNWSVKGQSTCSDDEIETIERPSVLYTFKYSKDFPITISTTRPETKVGDTAVAVHPDDPRYVAFQGQVFNVAFCGKQLSIKVITSLDVDPTFGTGALGVTPAHSTIDFAMYEIQKAKNDPIEIIQVIGQDGTMTAEAGIVAGQNIEEARLNIVNWLSEQGLLESSVDVVQNVGTSDRYNDVIESIPMTQWWLDVNKNIPGRSKNLRDLMREAVTTGLNGDINQKVNITPDRITKDYLNRVANLHDWCLSRQIWWGHRIPAWYRGDEIYVGTTAPIGDGWIQDEDTLDTWFSSGSWTFSTLGWPDETSDLKTFHPTSWIQMGYEIRYLWLMRMILMSTYALNQIPFKDVYLHGLLRDKNGNKFSKSSGNNIDPIDVINEYGCDALRLSVLSGNTPGNDSRYYTEKVEASRNLVNKLWNISRFIMTDGARHVSSVTPTTLADRWILGRFSETITKVAALIERYDFSLAIEVLRDFTWTDLADWYLEIAKIEGDKSEILLYLLERLLIIWHPFAPFVTEEIYSNFDKGMCIVAKWPKAEFTLSNDDSLMMTALQETVVAVRNIRSEYNVEPKKLVDVSVSEPSMIWQNAQEAIVKLARIDKVVFGAPSSNAASIVVGGVTISVDLAGLIDVEKEKARLAKDIIDTEKYVSIQSTKLANKDFTDRAPIKLIDGERQKLADAEAKLVALKREQQQFI